MRALALAASFASFIFACTPNSAPPAPPPSPSTVAASVQPRASVAPPEPRPEPHHVRDARGVRAFFGELCRRAAAGDSGWVLEHVRTPFHGMTNTPDHGGEPLVGGLVIEKPSHIKELPVCQTPLREDAPIDFP